MKLRSLITITTFALLSLFSLVTGSSISAQTCSGSYTSPDTARCESSSSTGCWTCAHVSRSQSCFYSSSAGQCVSSILAYDGCNINCSGDPSTWYCVEKNTTDGITSSGCTTTNPTATPTPAPTSAPTPTAPPGWGACGSCGTCGGPAAECVRAPDGSCQWDPGKCGSKPPSAPRCEISLSDPGTMTVGQTAYITMRMQFYNTYADGKNHCNINNFGDGEWIESVTSSNTSVLPFWISWGCQVNPPTPQYRTITVRGDSQGSSSVVVKGVVSGPGGGNVCYGTRNVTVLAPTPPPTAPPTPTPTPTPTVAPTATPTPTPTPTPTATPTGTGTPTPTPTGTATATPTVAPTATPTATPTPTPTPLPNCDVRINPGTTPTTIGVGESKQFYQTSPCSNYTSKTIRWDIVNVDGSPDSTFVDSSGNPIAGPLSSSIIEILGQNSGGEDQILLTVTATGPGGIVTFTDTVNYTMTAPVAWWQVISGDVLVGSQNFQYSDVVSNIPNSCSLAEDAGLCRDELIIEDVDSSGNELGPGLIISDSASFGSGSGNANRADGTSDDWVADTYPAGIIYNYAYFDDLTKGKTFIDVTNTNQLRNAIASGGSPDFKYIRVNSNINFPNGNIPINTRKIIVFINGNVSFTDNTRISVDEDGGGFFMLVTNGSIDIHPAMDELEGVYFVDGLFSTGTNGASNDVPFKLRGMVAAMSGFNLQRNLGNDNVDQPAEVFEYVPEYSLNFPTSMSDKHLYSREVIP